LSRTIKDNRTEEQKIKDKLLLLYVINQLKEPPTEERLQLFIFAIQAQMKALGMETFSYDDWVWKDDENISLEEKDVV